MWYHRVVGNLGELPKFMQHYEKELVEARKECSVAGVVERNVSALPGITELRFSQLQEIEAVLGFLNIELRKEKQAAYKKFLENYNRALSSRDAEKYADAEPNVINMEMLVNDVALLRNKYLGIMKALDSKQWMLGHITKLRTAGMEDIRLD